MPGSINVSSRWARSRPKLIRAGFIGLALLAASVPAFGEEDRVPERDANLFLAHVSQPVQVRYFLAHPEQAPPAFADRIEAGRELKASPGGAGFTSAGSVAAAARGSIPAGDRFNGDTRGLPQNEESVAVCRSKNNVVLGGTNDYRGLLDPAQNFTGWHLSLDGGRTLAKEGLLPPIDISGSLVPSGGDPAVAADGDCHLFAASLNYDPSTSFPFGPTPSGVGLYRTTPATLRACSGGVAPACWPTRIAAAVAAPQKGQSGDFLDKEWLAVGNTGDGEHVWVVYTDFNGPSDLSTFTASINAVRCEADLSACSEPILISGSDQDVQFADVTIGSDNRTYISWAEIQGELEGLPQTFTIKTRIAPAASTAFGATRIVAREGRAIPFNGFLHANDFRVATYPKIATKRVGTRQRIFIVWDACRARALDVICDEPVINLAYSDNDGQSWRRRVLSTGGDNYFPTIASDSGRRIAVAWYTTRFDRFHHRQDVELVTLDPATANVTKRQRVTQVSNEPDADSVLGGVFIGDYFEVFAHRGIAYIHYNANYVKRKLMGEGLPEGQQDNYLTRRRL
jgi:hypothetical protein